MRDYDRRIRAREPVTVEVRRRNSIAYTELYGAVHAEQQRCRHQAKKQAMAGAPHADQG